MLERHQIMSNKKIVKKIIDDFLTKKEGKSILKDIEKKKLVDEGLIDSLDILTIASDIEKKTNKKIDISKSKNYNKFNNYKDLINF
jgi:acyl carrier protein